MGAKRNQIDQHFGTQMGRNFTSKYPGVSWDKEKKKWVTFLTFKGKSIYLGRYKCELAAYKAYTDKLKEI